MAQWSSQRLGGQKQEDWFTCVEKDVQPFSRLDLQEGGGGARSKPTACGNWAREMCPQRMRQSSGPPASPGELLSDLAPKLTSIDQKGPKVTGLSKQEQMISVKSSNFSLTTNTVLIQVHPFLYSFK